jgi:hypothetical protein
MQLIIISVRPELWRDQSERSASSYHLLPLMTASQRLRTCVRLGFLRLPQRPRIHFYGNCRKQTSLFFPNSTRLEAGQKPTSGRTPILLVYPIRALLGLQGVTRFYPCVHLNSTAHVQWASPCRVLRFSITGLS